MAKRKSRLPNQGSRGFQQYYSEAYPERWGRLHQSLTAHAPRVAWQYGEQSPQYYLDPASLIVAHLLPLGEDNLDLCAAPGGKALILASRMQSSAHLVANERSRDRRARLRRVLAEHLPGDLRSRVEITGHDAARWGLHEPDRYDAVLADVPCSSERHVLADPRELERWSASRVRRLAVRQFAILAAAIDSTRPGGHVLYSTCALTREENDAVVNRALERRGEKVTVREIALSDLSMERLPRGDMSVYGTCAEPTEFGLQFLPDCCHGAGPMYCSLLRRK